MYIVRVDIKSWGILIVYVGKQKWNTIFFRLFPWKIQGVKGCLH